MNEAPYRILLYYKYVLIDDPEQFAAEHRALCNRLGLKGRIIVASEGINGTVSGLTEQTDAYIQTMQADVRFEDMEFKIDPYDGHAFKKMFVRVRPELVTMRLEDDVDPRTETGRRLAPKAFLEALGREDVIVIDGRNDYEYDLGHFRGAIRPEVSSFREFPDWIRENLADQKDKTVLTYCTGGIRCEKLSGFLLREGFQNVFQLHGGIVTYGKDPDAQGQYFDGKCYVFDERIGVPINQVEDVVVGQCYHCGGPADTYINCEYPACHRQHLVCDACHPQHAGYCSEPCKVNHETRISAPQ